MQDITLTTKLVKSEIKLIIFLFIASFLLNVIAIIIYNTEWKELYTQIFWVIAIALSFYGLSVILRLIYYSIKYLIKK